ncbi:MAG: glycerol-3-phosphate dehydrogenase, partial [Acinetobacter sp.]
SVTELGQNFGHGLFAKEVDYLIDQEWAVLSEDILKRRTKLYLEFEPDQVEGLDEYLVESHKRRSQEIAA